ncbi:RNA polymerase sigma factor SigJ [Bailinhaonella thermotolerans]|uniref:Sigma-70 family RNA polymerase sigma factor n=1 Tax=Bailinhaonella thermotolerans TaxID=1070861 RepID=A0A3A4ATD5_9ACTN|nr:RNA polymerase sigma factor SigJ [Bailinhaonella thermotolerans]RJL33240.1 sigma-70 family RNA polymerase sigma factor [Bailinhaonella thermotolerans]
MRDADDAAVFEGERGRLFGLAYRMLGSAAEAEDVVQDAYLRWRERYRVETPGAWLTRVVVNLCLNRLGAARVRRESYPGTWLPEPVLTGDGALGPLETVERREGVSLGLLAVLERLTPAERAVFVLREAFGYPHGEIGALLDVSEAHSRQLHRRARARVREARKRFDADPVRHRVLVERFLAATMDGDVAALGELLAEDVVAWADGGGETAARRPVRGREKVLRYLRGMSLRPEAPALIAEVAEVNGAPAVLIRHEGALRAVLAVEIAGGRVAGVRTVVSPGKLAFAARQAV